MANCTHISFRSYGHETSSKPRMLVKQESSSTKFYPKQELDTKPEFGPGYHSSSGGPSYSGPSYTSGPYDGPRSLVHSPSSLEEAGQKAGPLAKQWQV